MNYTTSIRCNIRFHKYSRNFIYNFILLLFFIGNTTAQSTLINPTGDGGFESGATFAANNWSVTTGAATRNQWTCNTGATAGFSGTRAAYITNNTSATPPPHSYTLNAIRVSHLYRTVTIPAGQTTIALSFNWIGVGEGTTLDRLRVWLVPNAFTPTYGTEITTTAPNGSIGAGLPNYNGQATWTTANITIPSSYAGTSFKLVFEWRNDDSLGTQPPAAIDDISLVSSIPGPCVAPSAATAFLPGTITPTTFPATFSGSANGYLVVRSLTNTPPIQPTNGTTYSAGNVATLGAAFTFVQSDASTAIGGTGLASGTPYYYFIYAYNNTGCTGGPVYNALAPLIGSGTTVSTPANDNCSGAIALTVNPTLICTTTTAGTTGNTTQSQVGCVGTADDDVWYSFSATSTSHIVSVTPTTLSDAVLQVFSGTCAGTLTSLSCTDNTLGANVETTTLTGLSIGTTYFVRVYSYASAINQGTFSICVTTVTLCQPPVLLNTTNITTTSATINWTPPAIVPSTGYEYIVSTVATTPTVAGIATTGLTANLTTLTANTTYYVFLRSNCGGTFSAWTAAGIFQTGYCLSTSTSSTYYISNFSTTGGTANIANNASGYSATGYGNFTGQAVSQINLGSVSFSVAMYNGTYTYGFNIWVDWNDDLDFNDVGELVYASGTYVSSATGSITVPAAASIGNHRMRIRANYLSTNPNTCGSISSGETEDYTFTVLPPLPCSGNPTNIVATVTSQTTATLNWLAPASIPSNGYQYYVSLSNATPSAAVIPSGSVGAGITTASLTGLLAGSSYSFWVRSNCGGGLGQGVWIGPINFYQPNCNIGNGIGTTTLACPDVVSGGLGLNGSDAFPINSCVSSACVELEATYVPLAQTTSYTVSSIPYAPPYQFGCLQNPVSINIDDVWSQPINLPFNFCFYGNIYSQCLIGSNGVITFDQTNNLPGGYSTWSFANSIPNATLFKNTIFGVYHDINPSVGGEVGWELITLNNGCRALVASWSNIPMFSTMCNTQLYTGMMVLYENTNVIDVYIKEKNICSTWNSGNAIVGIQNIDGTQAVAPPNRNDLNADWAVTEEAWRFTPSGPSIASIKWHEGAGTGGPVIATTDNITVCPVTTTVYTAEVSYTLCDGTKVKKTDQTTVTVNGNKIWNGSVDTDWNKANNWTPVGIPTALDCVVIGNTPIDPIISGSSYNAYAFSLSIQNGGALQVDSSNTITVTDAVNVVAGGQFNILNSASLVQVNNVANTGVINVQRVTQPMYRFDYTYWGSPVTFSSNFTLGNLSPQTLSDKYFSWIPSVSNGFGNWLSESVATIMNPIKGYIVRAPQHFSYTPTLFVPYIGNFVGTPNNGNIFCPIYHGNLGTGSNNDKYNLLGNPYPSAVDAQAFLRDPANIPIIDGTIYFWTHNSAPSTEFADPFFGDFVINYTDSDYATWNSLGSVGTRGSVALSGDILLPNGYIGTGQGFFTKSTGTAPSGNPVVFKNYMRSGNNTQFFRTSNNSTNEKHRVWLNLLSQSGSFNQILVGYINDATEGWDRNYDGVRFTDNNSITFYSVIPEKDLVIQGRPTPFSEVDRVPLGFKSTLQENFSLRLDHFDGLFDSQNIYIEDTFLNVIHDLKQSPYIFTSDIGTFNQRLILRYTDTALTSSEFDATSNIIALIYQKNLIVEAAGYIQNVAVFDISGKLINTYLPKNKSMKISENFIFAEGVYLVKIKLENGLIVTKKLIHKLNP